LGKFGVLGNHDSEVGRGKIKNAMLAAGITPLVNENRKITIGGEKITIAGTDETWYGEPDGAEAMENATPFTIYLTHDPWYLEQYRPAAQLLLAGHTHGGQVTLFGIPFANLVHWRNYKYQKGIFFENGRTIIVTNGIGATLLPLRFFARPQINLITLERSN
jgi:predicted MPP superfamily phosphohydrolase